MSTYFFKSKVKNFVLINKIKKAEIIGIVKACDIIEESFREQSFREQTTKKSNVWKILASFISEKKRKKH